MKITLRVLTLLSLSVAGFTSGMEGLMFFKHLEKQIWSDCSRQNREHFSRFKAHQICFKYSLKMLDDSVPV